MIDTKKSINLFVVYAPEDELLKEKLVEHLSILRHQGLISVFDEGNINAGEDWQQRKTELLNNAHLILLLISSDLLASDNLYNEDVVKSLQRHNKGEACVVPILLRDCVWKTSIFANLKSLPKNGYAVTDTKNWQSVDAAFKDVALGINKVLGNFKQQANGTYRFDSQTNIVLPENLTNIGNTITPKYTEHNNEHQQNKKAYYWFAALVLAIILLVVVSLLYNRKIPSNNNKPPIVDTLPKIPLPIQAVQGLWLSSDRDETFIAKMLFKDDFVEVFSRSNNKNLSWGIEKMTVENDRKLSVEYKDWGIRFSINVEDPSIPAQVDSIIFTYRSDTIKSLPVPLLNIILVRPLLAQQNANPKLNTSGNPSTTDTVKRFAPMSETMPVDTNTVSLRQLKISPTELIKETEPEPEAPPKSKPPIKRPNVKGTVNGKAAEIRKDRENLKTNRAAQLPNTEKTAEQTTVKINDQAVQSYMKSRLISNEYMTPDTNMTLIQRTLIKPK